MSRFEFRVRQELLDREMAPAAARCSRCGGEIYRPGAAGEGGVLCADCLALPAKTPSGPRHHRKGGTP